MRSTLGAGRYGPVFDIGTGEWRESVQLLRKWCGRRVAVRYARRSKPAPGQCVAMVDYAGEAMIADGDNPLYGISLLQHLISRMPVRPQLEELPAACWKLRGAGLRKTAKLQSGISGKHKIDEAALQGKHPAL